MCSFRLCGSIVANPIIYRLVPSPSRYEIRQCTEWREVRESRTSAFSSQEAAILLVSTENHDLWPGQPRPQGSFLSCAGNIGTPGQAQRHSGFEWLCKHNSWVARDVIIFENPKLKNHQSYYLHQAWERVNLYLLKTFQRRNMLRLKAGTF